MCSVATSCSPSPFLDVSAARGLKSGVLGLPALTQTQSELMPRRHWTLLFITDGAGDIKQLQVPRVMVQLAIAAVLVVVSALSSVGTAFVMKARAPKAANEMEVKSALLKRELAEIRDQVGLLHEQIDSLAYNDEQFRLVAGLEPIDHDVQRVGIGGSLVNSCSSSACRPPRPSGSRRRSPTRSRASSWR